MINTNKKREKSPDERVMEYYSEIRPNIGKIIWSYCKNCCTETEFEGTCFGYVCKNCNQYEKNT